MWPYPIRCVSPVQIPGAPPMVVRHTAPIEITYNVGALAANATYIAPTIDISNPDSRTVSRVIAHKAGAASTGQYIALQVSRDGTNWYYMPFHNGSNNYVFVSGTAAELIGQGVPTGRYVRVLYKNGSTAQTNLNLFVTLLP